MRMNMKKFVFSSLFVVIAISLFFSTSSVEAAAKKLKSIVQDNFNNYTDGILVGQGGWIDRANGSPFVVQGAVVKEGAKALYSNNSGADSVITKNGGTALTDGREFVYIRTENRANWGDAPVGENVTFGVYQGSWDGPTRALMGFKKDGHAAYIDTSQIATGAWLDFDTYTDNSWTLAEIEWRSIDKSARFRISNGRWTKWTPFVGASSFTGFDTIGLFTESLGTGGVYIDDLH